MKTICSKLKNDTGQVLAEYIVSTCLLTLAALGVYQLLPWVELNSKQEESVEAKLKVLLPNLVERL